MRQRHNVHLSDKECNEIAHWTRPRIFVHGGLFAAALLAVLIAGAVSPATDGTSVHHASAAPPAH